MKNYNLKLLKKSALSVLKNNYKTIATLSAVFLLIQVVIQVLFTTLGLLTTWGGTLLCGAVSLLVSAPLTMGILQVYYKLGKKKIATAKDGWLWYTEGKKLADSLKSVCWFCGTLLMWFSIYVLFPVAVVYMIWGKSLMNAQDLVLTFATFLVVMAAVCLVACLPYLLHMMRYTGGLFLTAQETHLKVSMRYPVGKDYIVPHIYRYALLVVTFLPYLLLALIPMGFALFNWAGWGVLTPIVLVAGTLFLFFYVLPYLGIAALMLFERMQRPKEAIPYTE